ncbi:MAG: hypothetical protein JOZ25_02695 [Actinobacteria bacterium]|nr:hypothetical protein [Actinomycetota bacterium]
MAASGGGAIAAASDFENPACAGVSCTPEQFLPGSVQRQDTPAGAPYHDPGYDFAEPDTQGAQTSSNLYDERYDLFGFPSEYTRTSAMYLDPLGPNFGNPQVSGYNAAGAWKLTRGDGRAVIAILDTGIRWDDGSLRDQVHLNTGELPLPEDASGHTNPGAGLGGFDLNNNGVVDVDDFANDPRVPHTTSGAGGKITAEDLIKAFGHCQITNHVLGACPAGGKFDNDHNGYPNDIAGWNFFDDDNDPVDRSSYFAAHNHGSGRAGDAAGAVGTGNIGVCPHCQLMPLRIWDTFVSDANSFSLGILYATDNGAKVIEGADGALYHSAFSEQASNYAYDHGVVQTYSGDDLNTGDHNYPANYGHAMLIQGTVPDTDGLGQNCPNQSQPLCAFAAQHGAPIGTHVTPTSYFRGANTTQYGGKSSISMNGSTGSINTGRASGGAGLVVSAALQSPTHDVLRPDETREILEQTAEDVTPGNTGVEGTPDPSQVGWDTHFGWGRANLGAAVAIAAQQAKIPDEAAIDQPDWYAPVTGSSLTITGRADARFNGHKLHYKLQWGPGLEPTDSPTSQWQTVKEGDATGPISSFGTIDLNAVRSALASFHVPPDPGGPVFSPTTRNPYQDQFTVRLIVTDQPSDDRLQGVDRRVFTALPDGQSLRPGYPKPLGTGGEAQPRYADLNGDNVPELIVPTEDGKIHAYEPNGSELPGWPVHTQTQWNAAAHTGAPGPAALIQAGAAPFEPPRGPAIADLDGDGIPEVITTAGLHLYVWEPDGTLRRGFPVSSDRSFCGPALERQPGTINGNDPGSHPKCGFSASPAIAHLEGPSKPPDIVVTSLDGHVYAWRPDGQPVPHFPVALVDPHPPNGIPAVAESINEPAVVDFAHDGHDDIVAATNETYGGGTSSDVSFAGLLGSQGQTTRVYAIDGGTGHIMSGWPISISGIIETELPFVGPGNDPAVVNVNGTPEVVASATSGSLSTYKPDGTRDKTMRQETDGPASDAVDKTPGLNLFEGAAIGALTPGSNPSVVKYELSSADAANLLLVSQNFPYNHLIGAWDSTTGTPAHAYPRITDDFQFLSSSTVAKVNPGSSANQVLAGTGLGLLHAYDGTTGLESPGFPKVTGGWLFAPPALSTDGRIADVDREGYLFEWSAPNLPACQPEWPTFRHDPQNTGNYNRDGTPPAAPRNMSLKPLGDNRYRMSFVSPGDDGFCGKAASYSVRVDGRSRDIGLGSPVAGGSTVSRDVTLPAGAGDVTLQAIDKAGNVGEPADVFLIATPGKPACRAPHTTIDAKTLNATRKRITLTGIAQEYDCKTGKRIAGHVKSMRLTVALILKGKCRFMNGGGRLGHTGSCSKPHLLRVRVVNRHDKLGLVSWIFRHKVHLPTGRYVIAIRAGDAAGHRESQSRSANTVSFKLFR